MNYGHTILRPQKEYFDGLDNRIETKNLEESIMYTFMGLTEGKVAEAVSANVTLESFRREAGHLALFMCMKDVDLKTAFKVPSRVISGLWQSDDNKCLYITRSEGEETEIVQGYFLEAETDLDLELLLASEQLTILGSAPRS